MAYLQIWFLNETIINAMNGTVRGQVMAYNFCVCVSLKRVKSVRVLLKNGVPIFLNFNETCENPFVRAPREHSQFQPVLFDGQDAGKSVVLAFTKSVCTIGERTNSCVRKAMGHGRQTQCGQ